MAIYEPTSETSRVRIPDSELEPLKSLVANGRTRGPRQSRFDFLRDPDSPEMVSRRFDEKLSDEKASEIIAICGQFLELTFSQTRKNGRFLTNNDLGGVYRIVTSNMGLSRLEAEELAPDNREWLNFCINLPCDYPQPNVSNA